MTGPAAQPRWIARLLTLLGSALVVGGGLLLAVAGPGVTASGADSAFTLTLTTSAPGASCDDSTYSGPVCSGVSSGDVITVAAGGLTPSVQASIVECSSVATQPVIAPYPVSCSALSPVTVPSSGPQSGEISGTFTVASGVLGPPETGDTPSCQSTSGWPTTALLSIPDCATSGDATTDAAQYPCPPTASQQAQGYVCTLGVMDDNDDRVVGTLLFGTETLPLCSAVVATTYPTYPCAPSSSSSSPGTGSGSSSSSPATSGPTSTSTSTQPARTTSSAVPVVLANQGTPPTTATAVPAPSSSLAVTGPGPGLHAVFILGAALLLAGLACLQLTDAPSRLVRATSHLRSARRSSTAHNPPSLWQPRPGHRLP